LRAEVKPPLKENGLFFNILIKKKRLPFAAGLYSFSGFPQPSRRTATMLRTRLKEALTTAMKARDAVAVATLRLILAALKDRDIAARGKGNLSGIPDEAILDLLQSMIRQRHESIDLYRIGERLDLVAREGAEIEVIQRFLPAQMDDAEVESAVGETIADLKATSLKDMGRTMAALKERYGGRMDFAKASAIVKQQLT